MALEFRPTNDNEAFDLYDETGKVGEIAHHAPTSEPDDDFESWTVDVWSMDSRLGKSFGEVWDTKAEALVGAVEAYQELLAERRAQHSPQAGPRITVVPSPMGGQRRR